MTEQEQKQFQYRRMPAQGKKISEINLEKDVRVRLLGQIIDKYDGTFVLDDGTGKAEIIAEDAFEKFKGGDFVRVFCRVIPLESGCELRAEIVQDMNSLDRDLYVRIFQ